jgi:hypothetical protein
MPKTLSAPRSPGRRRNVTIDLRAEHWDRLLELAREKDLPASTMARLLLLPALGRASD